MIEKFFNPLGKKSVENKLKEQIKRNILESAQKYSLVFNTPEGKWVLEDLKKRAFEDRTTFDANPHKMAFNEGRRSLLKHIEKMANRDVNIILAELEGDNNA